VTSYRVVRGINFPSGEVDAEGKALETRLEPGAEVTDADLKLGNVPWFLEVGAIEEVQLAKGTGGFADFGAGTPVKLHGRETVTRKNKE